MKLVGGTNEGVTVTLGWLQASLDNMPSPKAVVRLVGALKWLTRAAGALGMHTAVCAPPDW